MIYWLYVLQMAWYIHCTFFHVFVDIRKYDFWPMVVHHLATIGLLYASFSVGHFRIGLLTLYCMDVCDVFLHFGKLIRFVDNVYHNRLCDLCITLCFFGLVTTWVYYRLILFPVKVLYVSSVVLVHYLGYANADNAAFFNVLLFVVYILQIYWFYLIAAYAIKVVCHGKQLDDERDPSIPEPEAVDKND